MNKTFLFYKISIFLYESFWKDLYKRDYRKNERGYSLKPKHFRSWLRPMRVLSFVPVSRNWYMKLCQIHTKIYIYITFCKKNSRFKRIIFSKYTINLKTTISQRSLRNLNLLLLLFEFNKFLFLIDLIDNIINTKGSAVSLSRDSVCIMWPVYCTAYGGSSGHV